jgi:hypothetical protein
MPLYNASSSVSVRTANLACEQPGSATRKGRIRRAVITDVDRALHVPKRRQGERPGPGCARGRAGVGMTEFSAVPAYNPYSGHWARLPTDSGSAGRAVQAIAIRWLVSDCMTVDRMHGVHNGIASAHACPPRRSLARHSTRSRAGLPADRNRHPDQRDERSPGTYRRPTLRICHSRWTIRHWRI